MSRRSSHYSGSDSSSCKNLLKQISKDLQSFQLWRIQEERQREEKGRERESHLAVLEEVLLKENII